MHCSSLIFLINLTHIMCFTISTGPTFNTSLTNSKLQNKMNNLEIIEAIKQSINSVTNRGHRHRRKERATKKVCYDELGCFEDSGPFSYLEILPSPPEEINTKFYFYSTKNRSDGPLVELSFSEMKTEFDPSSSTSSSSSSSSSEKKQRNKRNSTLLSITDLNGFDELHTRVIVHGFGSACPHVWIYEMKAALMAVENCIVICVDWENGATVPNYVRAAANTRLVGKQLAMLLKKLQELKQLDLGRTHIIGFSLGAHVAGFAGSELPGLYRITGLDPAGPLFESQHPDARLDDTDAKFVDVIHSNGENLILGGLGSWQPMGHVDFYPNGGRVQTGCSNLFLGAVTDFIWSQATDVEGRSLCNHRRAYKFFIDSVAPRCLFPAFPCDSYDNFVKGKCFSCIKDNKNKKMNETGSHCGNMGYYADKSSGRGQLYLVTREEEPFCANQFRIEIFNSFNDLPLRTVGKLEAALEGEGGLNETFLITEKDDAEFFAGDVISKIIVLHPALGFPTSLTLTYKSYNGWLSKGLRHWDIDKIVLTDSFGRSHSLCQTSLSLVSGEPMRITLIPGDCDIMKSTNAVTFSTSPSSEEEVTTTSGRSRRDEIRSTGNIGFENLNDNKTVNKSNTSKSYIVDNDSQPNFSENLLEMIELSRSFEKQNSEIFEPILNNRFLSKKGRNLDKYDKKEILEPILKPKKQTNTMIDKDSISKETIDIKINQPKIEPISVQLLPIRLADILERAERYARETLLPLVTEQSPRFFDFKWGKKPQYFVTSKNTKFEVLDNSKPNFSVTSVHNNKSYITTAQQTVKVNSNQIEEKPFLFSGIY